MRLQNDLLHAKICIHLHLLMICHHYSNGYPNNIKIQTNLSINLIDYVIIDSNLFHLIEQQNTHKNFTKNLPNGIKFDKQHHGYKTHTEINTKSHRQKFYIYYVLKHQSGMYVRFKIKQNLNLNHHKHLKKEQNEYKRRPFIYKWPMVINQQNHTKLMLWS